MSRKPNAADERHTADTKDDMSVGDMPDDVVARIRDWDTGHLNNSLIIKRCVKLLYRLTCWVVAQTACDLLLPG